jgi:hypothetical protein
VQEMTKAINGYWIIPHLYSIIIGQRLKLH